MTRKILLVLLCCSAGLSGCERLSEKDKMDMIAKCDTEARKKFTEQNESDYSGNSINREVSTHYSFSDSRCYALEDQAVFVVLPDYNKKTFTYTLYDGLTKSKLLLASCTVDEIKKINECLDDGGYAMGTLVSENMEKRSISYKEGREIIDQRMNRP